MIFVRHPLIAEIGPHSFADRVCVEQVERKKATLVLERSDTDDVGIGTARLIELTTLAVYEHSIGTLPKEIGRATWRGRVWQYAEIAGGAVIINRKKEKRKN